MANYDVVPYFANGEQFELCTWGLGSRCITEKALEPVGRASARKHPVTIESLNIPFERTHKDFRMLYSTRNLVESSAAQEALQIVVVEPAIDQWRKDVVLAVHPVAPALRLLKQEILLLLARRSGVVDDSILEHLDVLLI